MYSTQLVVIRHCVSGVAVVVAVVVAASIV